jgi:cation diffusion facilitator family transporter
MPSESPSYRYAAVEQGLKSTLLGICLNVLLVLVKAIAGVLGNSYALVADAIESAADVVTSLVVFVGLKLAQKPPDETHPYGHGKFEPLAALAVGFALIGAAIVVAVESVQEILTPHHAPAPFTLFVLVAVILVKEYLFRFTHKIGTSVESTAVKADAWHHRSDALTSVAAFVGISIALIGGPGYESADDFAALVAAGVIVVNALLLLRPAIYELIDTAPNNELKDKIRRIASQVPGALGTHKCQVRKIGFDHYVDLDVLCDPEASVRFAHEVAHNVGEAIQRELPMITKVLVHIEPSDDYGRRSRDTIGVR